MANIPLQSISFPGLSDKYTTPVVDNTLTQAGAAADAKKVGDEVGAIKNDLSEFPNGTYPNMTVGNADQLTSTVGIEDTAPYLFRTSGGSNDIGDREDVRKIVGGTVVWNQFVRDGDLSQPSGYWNSKVVISGGYGTVNPSQKYDSGSQRLLDSPFVVNHKFLLLFLAKADTPEVLACGIGDNVTFTYTKSFNATTLWGSYGSIFSIPTSLTGTNQIIFIRTELDSGFAPFSFDNVMFTDLTQMLGTSIADYVYNLETATAGAGVSWLKKHFPAQFDVGYQAYDAGSLQSVSGLTMHKMVGFNQFDKAMIVNEYFIDDVTGEEKPSPSSKATGYIPVLPGVAYYIKSDQTSGAWGAWYDAEKNYISGITAYYANSIERLKVKTAPGNAHYMRLTCVYNNSGDPDTFCVNLHWDGEKDGQYEPYKEYVYPLDSSLTLRGNPKVDASGNLYYDGDEYLPDGTVNRRWGIVDMGTLVWGKSGTALFYSTSLQSVIKKGSATGGYDHIKCVRYVAQNTASSGSLNDKCMSVDTSGNIQLIDSDYASSTTAEFKTAMSGVYLLYEKATAETETAEPYQETQIVDDFGTEEFVLADGAFPVPIGHNTMYQNNLRAKLEMSPESPDGDGLYVVQQESGENTYVPLASTATIQDILTRLTALENA